MYDKQYGFQTGHSTDHASAQQAYQIYKTLDKNKYTLRVFVGLCKALNTTKETRAIWYN